MVLSSGFYRTQFQGKTLHLVQSLNEPHNVQITENINEEHVKFRKDKNGWLSIDDGLLGRYGNPEHLLARVNGTVYRVWVEQRGRDQFGLIPTDESGQYSNKFLGISKDGDLKIEDEWNTENGTVWVVSSKLGGPAGL